MRDGRVLIARRARAPAHGVYTLPGGVVEVGETLHEAIAREIAEETDLAIEPVALAGYRERIAHDGNGRVEQHFVILPFAARLIAGEPVLNEELAEARWLAPSELAGFQPPKDWPRSCDRLALMEARPSVIVARAFCMALPDAKRALMHLPRAGSPSEPPRGPITAAMWKPRALGARLTLASPAQAQARTTLDDSLTRLSEILGALHYLRGICGSSEGNRWRTEMQALIDAEAPRRPQGPHDRRLQPRL